MIENQVIEEIRSVFLQVYEKLGTGFEKGIYEQALMIEMDNRSLPFHYKRPVNIYYDGIAVGECAPDFLLYNEIALNVFAGSLILEKETEKIDSLCESTFLSCGIILNFGREPEMFCRPGEKLFIPDAGIGDCDLPCGQVA